MKECVKISLSTYDEFKTKEANLELLVANYQKAQNTLYERCEAAEKKFDDLVRYLSSNRVDVDSVYELYSWTRDDLEAIGLLDDVEKVLSKVRAEKKEAKEQARREAEAQAELEKSEVQESRSESVEESRSENNDESIVAAI